LAPSTRARLRSGIHRFRQRRKIRVSVSEMRAVLADAWRRSAVSLLRRLRRTSRIPVRSATNLRPAILREARRGALDPRRRNSRHRYGCRCGRRGKGRREATVLLRRAKPAEAVRLLRLRRVERYSRAPRSVFSRSFDNQKNTRAFNVSNHSSGVVPSVRHSLRRELVIGFWSRTTASGSPSREILTDFGRRSDSSFRRSSPSNPYKSSSAVVDSRPCSTTDSQLVSSAMW